VAVDEVRVRLRRRLEELVGMEEAGLLMDRPPGGWGDVVTRSWLDERLRHERALTDERFAVVDERLRSLDERFDTRLRSLDARFDTRLQSLEERFDVRPESLESRIDGLGHETLGTIDGLRHEVLGAIDGLRHEVLGTIDRAFAHQTWRIVGAVTALMAVVVAALRI
jgi:hypothetical protein